VRRNVTILSGMVIDIGGSICSGASNLLSLDVIRKQRSKSWQSSRENGKERFGDG
jgi:hypothetical protein